MVSEEAIVEYIAKLDGVSSREEKGWQIFEREGKIFLCIEKGKTPLRLELRCDRKLGKTLQERYESVMESRSLGRNGIEIICSGQLTDEEILDLIRHSFEISMPDGE